MLLLSVNQTILFALSMVVIAGLIGGDGLGNVVTSGLYSDPAHALLAGVAIVIMAISLDRATEAMANRTDPAQRHLTEGKRRTLRLYTLACAAAVGLAVGLGYLFDAGSVWSRWTASDWLLARVQSVLDYVQSPSTFIFHITSPIGNFLVQYGLSPLRSFFVETPWPAMVFGLAAIAFLAVRPASRGDHARDARDDRSLERVGERDGHAVAGARRDALHAARRDPARRVGGGEHCARARRCGRCSTCCRRCHNSSTSFRSSI